MPTAKQIERISTHFGYGNTLPQTEKEHLIAQLVPCAECQSIEGIEISHELLGAYYFVRCGCSKSTDPFDTIEEALEEWKLLNGDE